MITPISSLGVNAELRKEEDTSASIYQLSTLNDLKTVVPRKLLLNGTLTRIGYIPDRGSRESTVVLRS